MKKFIFTVLMLAIPFCMQLHARGPTRDQLITMIEELENEENAAQAALQAAVQEGENQAVAMAQLQHVQLRLERFENVLHAMPISGHSVKGADE